MHSVFNYTNFSKAEWNFRPLSSTRPTKGQRPRDIDQIWNFEKSLIENRTIHQTRRLVFAKIALNRRFSTCLTTSLQDISWKNRIRPEFSQNWLVDVLKIQKVTIFIILEDGSHENFGYFNLLATSVQDNYLFSHQYFFKIVIRMQ